MSGKMTDRPDDMSSLHMPECGESCPKWLSSLCLFVCLFAQLLYVNADISQEASLRCVHFMAILLETVSDLVRFRNSE